MRLDEIDWIFIVAVICGSIGSVIGEIEHLIGSENLAYFVLALKILSAILSIAFAIFKFYRLKPYEVILADKDFLINGDMHIHKITKSTHRKGSHPSVYTSLLLDDGLIQSVSIYDEVDTDGNVIIAHNGMEFDQRSRKLRVIIKA
ncbi:hypothetical protein [Plesiomonas shigelloides]|uniref:hypothetical protein n=1 Tax=Plesiomonas shigelloides TaxID=703 RepID=UPI0012622B9D|nr:hypothetical protein [Plesiomonas shigelloides]KAB7661234.1 hypothetical protein GBN25_15135 [Plesiomonas shigelloides]